MKRAGQRTKQSFPVLRFYAIICLETEKSHTVSIVTIATLQAKNQFSDFWYEK